ncbi:conserved Plasmodium protein, unknown function [Plasmodium berghei]|uniref:Fam-b protein n=2 Tax=Plasmodium berghei TaxID=5821 RepID=A0A509AIA7_PLABA|nr:conserved Plasmodium protein, unknown function [Plasmodium berghei ANKA]CXI30162.1 conserved Plasmodium protein, unknown function [Plasmodium berghei]SCM20826.1 conserved Plasmodium protein, unknown function [Plasmodium berghei]SCN24340.1 conserved Plasmodium protein, unknown function [Plasmodium berghei]SCO59512.1 conserved Plasmodium protein, unknown function [Plasmodium berghei]SCO60740.1 conserved Plasmodium protein, unknown function [Plasmodium berghei]|eukprot:XP_034421042.1 conserved Plasmodium protein, unknown function [Plasmodium berghei ANKA]
MNLLLYFLFLYATFWMGSLGKVFSDMSIKPMHLRKIKSKNDIHEDNYYAIDDVYYVEDTMSKLESDINNRNKEDNIIDHNDRVKINNLSKLNNTNIFKSMNKLLYESKPNDKSLNKQITKILNIILNTPKNETINIKDINSLLKKWKDINKIKQNRSKLNNNEKKNLINLHNFNKNTKVSDKFNTFDELEELSNKDNINEDIPKSDFINIHYLLELTH